MLRSLSGLVAASVVLLTGCGDDGSAGPDAGRDAGPVDAGADTAAPVDSGVDSAVAMDICDELSLPRAEWHEGTGSAYGDVAGDFTVNTLSEPFTFSEAFTGCESYVFINYFNAEPGDTVWGSLPDPLFDRSARNVHYFFATYEENEIAAMTRAIQMRDNVEEALSLRDPAEADFWREHIHYVIDPLTTIEGSIGDLIRGQRLIQFAFGIDRGQRFDPVGSLAEVTRSGFVSRMGMAAYASHYYNYRAELLARLDAEAATTTRIPLVDEVDFSEREFDRIAELPDAATMAGFDTMEVDVEITCRRDAPDCSEWDRIAQIDLCLDDPCTERREIVRWITPYSRPGQRRWIIDASPFLGLVRDGGSKMFRVVLGPGFERATERDVRISIRLAERGADRSAIGAERAFTGGAFDAMYNGLHAPFHFTPPAGTTRVELVVLISGHGQTDGDNCAEWCNHEHEWAVGGSTYRIDYPGEAGMAFGCAARVVDGVIPGQYGNWAPSRAGWCPGLPVPAERFDITDAVSLSGDNELTYTASFEGGEPRGGNIDLSAYVVYYR